MTHSIPANSAPTFPKPFPLLHIPLPISLNISRAFWVLVIAACDCARKYGSSYAKDADMREKKAPMPRPMEHKEDYQLEFAYSIAKNTEQCVLLTADACDDCLGYT